MTTTSDTRFLLGGDLPVARMGFGAMRLPARGWEGPANDPETAVKVLRRAVDLGVNHIDTAWFYFHEDIAANDLIRKALHPYADDLVIAAKVGPGRNPDGSWMDPADARRLREDVHRSLRELGRDHLDLVYLRLLPSQLAANPMAELFGALAELRDEGLIRHLGISNVTTAHLDEALRIAPVAAVQNMYAVAHRPEPAVLDVCTERGIAYVPFFSLDPLGRPEPVDTLARIAARHDASTAQVKLAWLLAQSPAVLPIPGTSSVAHLEENIAAAGLRLDDEALAELNALTDDPIDEE
ncbi:aldo/keto reductase [Streptomyces sp. NPDC093600]|uniref:aldo/keto reductase n=1 Tax=Streptomyces sp. NPDC093600 TaxID=3366047 RepID=UPI0037FFE4D2